VIIIKWFLKKQKKVQYVNTAVLATHIVMAINTINKGISVKIVKKHLVKLMIEYKGIIGKEKCVYYYILII
jgi:hypothetical protein